MEFGAGSSNGVFAKVIEQIVKECGDRDVKQKPLGADVKLTQRMAPVLLRMPSK